VGFVIIVWAATTADRLPSAIILSAALDLFGLSGFEQLDNHAVIFSWHLPPVLLGKIARCSSSGILD